MVKHNVKGAIFLLEKETKKLILKAENGVSKNILNDCKAVPVDRCLCGKAASSGEIQFTGNMDDCVAINKDKWEFQHGHYVVPIISSESETIGVINLYLEKGHKLDEGEFTFLKMAANTLAALIKSKQTENEKEEIWHQLLQAQKLESIGRLTGGIVHDFNNILTSIIGFSSIAFEKLPAGDPVKDIVGRIYSVGKKASTLINQLLAFSRKQVLKMKICNLNTIIGDMSEIFKRTLGEGITLVINAQDNIKNINADESQLEQVLMNLVLNARYAMSKGGYLTIKTEEVYLDEKYAPGNKEFVPGYYVVLFVEDTGDGMTKEVQERIFEPFFTTKKKGEGTGLGLSSVFGIIKQHNGFIVVKSELGKGSVFKIYLPAVNGDQKMREATVHEEAPNNVKGTETILITEDDDSIRELLLNIIEPKGYKLLLAENAEKALIISDQTKGKINLLLTDVVMPGRNGWELYNEMIKRRPDIKVIFISGLVENAIVLNNIQNNDMPFIKKPLIPSILLGKIREVLDEVG